LQKILYERRYQNHQRDQYLRQAIEVGIIVGIVVVIEVITNNSSSSNFEYKHNHNHKQWIGYYDTTRMIIIMRMMRVSKYSQSLLQQQHHRIITIETLSESRIMGHSDRRIMHQSLTTSHNNRHGRMKTKIHHHNHLCHTRLRRLMIQGMSTI
jgi:hypothetical protein